MGEFIINGDKNEAAVFALTFEEIQKWFVQMLPERASVMDLGCGSGRDTVFFKKQGLVVTPVECSRVLCNVATKHTGIKVRHMMYHELSEVGKYDGVWASSSIHHLPYEQLVEVLNKINRALKQNGVLYVSFKYGKFEGMRNGRHFTDMDEAKVEKMLHKVKGFEVERMTVTPDIRPDRESQQWMNVFLRKIQI